MELGKDYLGSGMKFPLEVDSITGRFKVSSAEDKVKESIRLILGTNKGERLMLPLFGSELNDYVFSSTDSTTINLMANSLRKVLAKYERRIKDITVNVGLNAEKPEQLNINISYVVAESNCPGNIVFPFYIQEGIDEDADDSE